MNERIKALEKQSYVDVDHGDGIYQQFNRCKFAELIIQECMSLREELSQFDGRDPYGDGYENGLRDMTETIAEHFGVE